MRNPTWLLALCLSAAAMAADFGSPPVSAPVVANVRAYSVRADLSNVSNRKQVPQLTAEQKRVLVANAFVARPTREEQLFQIYEDSQYRGIPSFVTTDALFHTYHVVYDLTLRSLEQDKLAPLLREMLELLLSDAAKALRAAPAGSATATALTHDTAYLAVPLRLLGAPGAVPAACEALVTTELGRIGAHTGRDKCLSGAQLDYTQFIPRGHYARSEVLQRYFRAMMWLGQVKFTLGERRALADGHTPVLVPAQRQALLDALVLTELVSADTPAEALWRKLADVTGFFAGDPDSLDHRQIVPLARRVFGRGALSRFDDDGKLEAFSAAAQRELPGPRVSNVTRENGVDVSEAQDYCLLGQRYTPDGRIMQELCYPKVGDGPGGRFFPMGLDIFAVLGNRRAAELLDGTYHQTKYARYAEQQAKLRKEFAGLSPGEWSRNLYAAWMYALQALLTPAPEGYPAFMRNTAWQDKSLVTALASWAQLRHDTLLYAKGAVAEAGGDEEMMAGYVEPNPVAFERLAWMLDMTRSGLLARGLIEEEDGLGDVLEQFRALAAKLAGMARKELEGGTLSAEELSDVQYVGGSLEALMTRGLNVANHGGGNWSLQNATERRMATAADVATHLSECLEEGVGYPAELWVVAPFKDRLVAFRGGSFTYYEFRQPAAARLTDEAWQARLDKGTAPAMPVWTRSYLLPPGTTQRSSDRAD